MKCFFRFKGNQEPTNDGKLISHAFWFVNMIYIKFVFMDFSKLSTKSLIFISHTQYEPLIMFLFQSSC